MTTPTVYRTPACPRPRPAFSVEAGDTCRLTTHAEAMRLARSRSIIRNARQLVTIEPVVTGCLPSEFRKRRRLAYWVIQDWR